MIGVQISQTRKECMPNESQAVISIRAELETLLNHARETKQSRRIDDQKAGLIKLQRDISALLSIIDNSGLNKGDDKDRWFGLTTDIRTVQNIAENQGASSPKGVLMGVSAYLKRMMQDHGDLSFSKNTSPPVDLASLAVNPKLNYSIKPDVDEVEFFNKVEVVISKLQQLPDTGIDELGLARKEVTMILNDLMQNASNIESVISGLHDIESCIILLTDLKQSFSHGFLNIAGGVSVDLAQAEYDKSETVSYTDNSAEVTPIFNPNEPPYLDTRDHERVTEDEDVVPDKDEVNPNEAKQDSTNLVCITFYCGKKEVTFSHIEVGRVPEFILNFEDQFYRRYDSHQCDFFNNDVKSNLKNGVDQRVKVHEEQLNFLRGKNRAERIERSLANTYFESVDRLTTQACQERSNHQDINQDVLLSICEVQAEIDDLRQDLRRFDENKSIVNVMNILHDIASVEVHLVETMTANGGIAGRDALKVMCMSYAAQYEGFQSRLEEIENTINTNEKDERKKRILQSRVKELKHDFSYLHTICDHYNEANSEKKFIECEKKIDLSFGSIQGKKNLEEKSLERSVIMRGGTVREGAIEALKAAYDKKNIFAKHADIRKGKISMPKTSPR